jgi:membrane peptidoglycan carboxypeptidase
LATQLEKYRHSEGGFTSNFAEKLLQMQSASLRTYQQGELTLNARKKIVLDYINTVPLASRAGYGEIQGFGDGLWVWFHANSGDISKALANANQAKTPAELAASAKALKQVMAIFLAHKRPSYFFLKSPEALENRCKVFLGVMRDLGMIQPQLYAAALNIPLEIHTEKLIQDQEKAPLGLRKATNAIRTRLLNVISVQNLYDLDRLDISVRSTFATQLQLKATDLLRSLSKPEFVQSHNLGGLGLAGGPLDSVIYSFTLYERTPYGNYLRVQTDNYNQPLNINDGSKLDLGSTAKVRTLVHYLELVERSWREWQGQKPTRIQNEAKERGDPLSLWLAELLRLRPEITLEETFHYALSRPFSANPDEGFYTGGGMHRFVNFGRYGGSPTLYTATQHSINLPFVRLMRELVQYHMVRLPEDRYKILTNPNNPQRKSYLEKFAEKEGIIFVKRFHRKYAGKSREKILHTFLSSIRQNPTRVGNGLCYLNPNLSFQEFAFQLPRHMENQRLSLGVLRQIYDNCRNPIALNDMAFLFKAHALEIATAKQMYNAPEMTQEQLISATHKDRINSYSWLYNSNRNAQNDRIHTLLEEEAFNEIHAAWARLGYPFNYLVPSLASALGASGDRPSALAELMGILVNDGVLRHAFRMSEIRIGVGTPYETHFGIPQNEGTRLLSPELCRSIKRALIGVVEGGTAGAIRGAFNLGNTPIPIGGKTGTGDVRFETFDKKGNVLTSRVVGRTATFAFFIGDKYYGTLTAFVRGETAGQFSFTSRLSAGILRLLAPTIREELLTTDSELLYASYDYLKMLPTPAPIYVRDTTARKPMTLLDSLPQIRPDLLQNQPVVADSSGQF